MIIPLLLVYNNIYAHPMVNSITIDPPAPNFGDRITVTIDYCGQLYNDHEMAVAISTEPDLMDARISGAGQVFIISGAGMNNHTSVPAASPGGEIGWTANPAPGAGAPGTPCTDCDGAEGREFTMVYGDDETLTVPSADNFPGCDNTRLYIHVGFKDANLNDGEYHTLSNCQEGHYMWDMPVLDTQFTMHKRAEGVVQDEGDLLLFSIDYEYANGALTITDSIPALPGGAWDLVSVGPEGYYTGPASGPVSAGDVLTWNLPDRSNQRGSAPGTVWFLLQARVGGGDPADGEVISNTADGSITGPTGSDTGSSTANVTIGQVVISLEKSQAMRDVEYGDNVTYYLEYQINGSKLIEYQPFDDMPLGAYTNPTPPDGWMYVPEGGAYGTWHIEDQCNTGDYVLRGESGGDEYPGLLIDRDLSGVGCTGGSIIMTDVLINPAGGTTGNGYEGADGLVVIRNDGVSPDGNAYALVLSIDDFIGDNQDGNVGFQVCNPNCDWPYSVDTIQITGNKWYRVKIETVSEYHFRAKVWPKGDPEPGGWTIDWTFTGANTDNMACTNGPWYAGVGQQGGANGTTQDSYNDFMIYEPRVSGETHIIDTLPTTVPPGGLTYLGEQGPYPLVGGPPVLDWDLGPISNEGGTFTWWAQVNTCEPFTNRGTIYGTGINAVNSNEVITYPICEDITGVTKTAQPTSVGIGEVVTFTIDYSNNGMTTIDNYQITDQVPAGMSFVGCDNGCAGTSPITWNLGALAPGASGTVSWWGTVDFIP